MRRAWDGKGGGDGRGGLLAQLRRPPGGRDARIMLLAQCVDRTGTGVWAAASVLYFTFVSGLDARELGLLLGVGAVAGIAGSPLAGRAAERLSVRGLLIGCHLLRLGTMVALLVADDFTTLLLLVALTSLGERAAKTLEMLFATRVAGERRTTYQALFRSVANAGYALGAGVAALGLAVGTTNAYRALILANALSYVLAAVLVRRTREPAGHGLVVAQGDGGQGRSPAPEPAPSPWRDPGYLLFVLLDIPMNLDDAVLGVGLPLWLVHHTTAPHAVVPAFLVINTVLVVVLQLRVSARAEGPREAASAVGWYGVTLLACCLVLATATGGGAWSASLAMLAAAMLVTLAELLRSVSSWELAVSLAPPRARASYLGVAGMAQSVQKSVGPPLLTGAVMTAGPAGWLALGAAVTVLSLVQRQAGLRRLAALAESASAGGAPRRGPKTPETPEGGTPGQKLGVPPSEKDR
ncbi:MFS transporter [Streptomyces actinomycinicus]|uniref:MFS transporter n=1 Tax=Streptomyces actinomycinicus TaxID=1695166 RepID=A0A937JM12_9ACTN|nr:MFS transporter [Streptomyces actinomycinicus]MBL1081851.1 MFS transporter [Streptomyces actinomycinicus]